MTEKNQSIALLRNQMTIIGWSLELDENTEVLKKKDNLMMPGASGAPVRIKN